VAFIEDLRFFFFFGLHLIILKGKINSNGFFLFFSFSFFFVTLLPDQLQWDICEWKENWQGEQGDPQAQR